MHEVIDHFEVINDATAPGQHTWWIVAIAHEGLASAPHSGDALDFSPPWTPGVAGALRISTWAEGGRRVGQVDAVEVRPDVRRRGVATELYRQALEVTNLTMDDLIPGLLTEDGADARPAIERKLRS